LLRACLQANGNTAPPPAIALVDPTQENHMDRVFTSLAALLVASLAAPLAADGLPNPFYAMDTSFQRPGLNQDQQFELIKELGYAGYAWHEQAPQVAKATAEKTAQMGLKMFTIYCAAKVTPQGELTHSPALKELMAALKGQGTTIWLHIGGKGPAFDSLAADAQPVKALRELADAAAENGLKIAIYPHVGEWTARFADATKLAKAVKHPAFGVTFNLCHAMAMGEEKDIPALLEEAKGVLVTVTICGADTGVTGGKWGQLIQTLDKGTYDVGIVLRKLKAIGFAGPVGFQGYGIKGDARSIVAPTMEAWKKLSAQAAK